MQVRHFQYVESLTNLTQIQPYLTPDTATVQEMSISKVDHYYHIKISHQSKSTSTNAKINATKSGVLLQW